MNEWNTDQLIASDKQFVWHPFTDMREWCAPEHEPLVLVEGYGAVLRDSRGGEYIDGNSSIWTNIHGHNHPYINAAIRRQLDRVAHTSFLGFTNPAAIELAQAIAGLFPDDALSRVFFSDDGSTGIEVALRIAERSNVSSAAVISPAAIPVARPSVSTSKRRPVPSRSRRRLRRRPDPTACR